MAKEKKEDITVVEVKILPDFENIGDIKKVYTNYMGVTHDEFGFVLTFCDSHFEIIRKKEDLKEKDEKGAYIIKAPIVAMITISPALIPKIIDALQTNYNKYVENRKTKKSE